MNDVVRRVFKAILVPLALLSVFPLSLWAQPMSLSKEQASVRVKEIWQELTDPLKAELEKEFAEKLIKFDGKEMPLLIREFGQPPAEGRSLFISMHGGGNAPSSVNDQQWRNQLRLYQPEEGLYIAPRAPTDTWNLWHEAHIDALFDRLILACVVTQQVNPDRVYLMGYSAGGDGVFQLAPRMSDRWAAASMMAGHPNETRPEGLRNVPFAIFMGGKDRAYDRNKIAAEWEAKLKSLAETDPLGYPHRVQIYPESGHWMNQQDGESIPWMRKYRRTCWPEKIVWVQDDVAHSRLYWLGVPLESTVAGSVTIAEVKGQTISIESKLEQIRLYLHDELIDLDQPVSVYWNQQEVFKGRLRRSEEAIRSSLEMRLDEHLAAVTLLELVNPAKPSADTDPPTPAEENF
jgi:hypothetical protein